MKKLAEMDSIEMATVMCKVAEPVGRIFADAEVTGAFVKIRETLGESYNRIQLIAAYVAHFIPVLLNETHRDDVFEVLAAVNGRTVEEIRQQPGTQTINELLGVFVGDGGMTTFFRPRKAARGE